MSSGGYELRKDLDERDRELRKAAAERDSELDQAADEADRENKPEKCEDKSQQTWAKYDEKRERVLARFEEKHGAAADREARPAGDRAGEPSDDVRRDRGPDRVTPDDLRRRDAETLPRDERREALLKKLAAVDRELDQEHDRHEARMARLRKTRDVRTDRGRDTAAGRATTAIEEENARHANRLGELESRRDELRRGVERREEELRAAPRR